MIINLEIRGRREKKKIIIIIKEEIELNQIETKKWNKKFS